ncbi:MAG: ABC transporter permease [Candidatus Kerfeldbacteria bacterium]|jgi:beta-exotoxin I transport system permease protein
MWTIFTRTIIDKKYSLLVYLIVGIALLWMYIAMFPAIQTQGEVMVKLIEQFPENVQKIMEGLGADAVSMTTIEGLLASKQYSLIWPLLAILLVAGFAGATIAGEIERGVFELTLSRPISRTKILMARYLAGLVMIFVFTFLSIYSIIPLAGMYDIELQLSNIFKLSILAFLFGWAVLSMSLFFSTLFSEKARTFALIGGLMMGMYILNTVALVSEKFEVIRYTSFFHYFDTVGSLINNTIGQTSIIVFVICIVVFTSLSIYFFNKRDIAV